MADVYVPVPEEFRDSDDIQCTLCEEHPADFEVYVDRRVFERRKEPRPGSTDRRTLCQK